MKFVSLQDLSYKQLLQYGIIGIFLGGALDTLFKPSPIIGVFLGAVSIFGWICLVWGIIKWVKRKKVRNNGPKQLFENSTKERISLIFDLVEETAKLFDDQFTYLKSHFQKTTNYQSEVGKAHELMLKGENLTDEDRIKIAKSILQMTDVYRKNLIQPLQEIDSELQVKLLDFERKLKGLLDSKEESEKLRKGLKDIIEYLTKLSNLYKTFYSNRVSATNSVIKYVECDEKLPALTITHGGKKNIQLSDEIKKVYAENVGEYNALMVTSWNKEKELNEEFKKLIKELDKFK